MTGDSRVPAIRAGAIPLGVAANSNQKRRRKSQKSGSRAHSSNEWRPTAAQLSWLKRGLDQPGGKLPLFDRDGQRINRRTVRTCIETGWAEPWFANPIKPDWLVCKLTEEGRRALGRD